MTSSETINAAIHESVAENPDTSIRHRVQKLDILVTRLHHIFTTNDLQLHDCKMLRTQLLPTNIYSEENFLIESLKHKQ